MKLPDKEPLMTERWNQISLPVAHEDIEKESIRLLDMLEEELRQSSDFQAVSRTTRGIYHIADDADKLVVSTDKYGDGNSYEAGVAIGEDPSKQGVVVVVWRKSPLQEIPDVKEIWDRITEKIHNSILPSMYEKRE